MANKTIGSVMIREIIRMKHKGFSNSKITQILGKSRMTILKYLSIIEASGLKTKALLKLSKEDLFKLLKFQINLIWRKLEQQKKAA